MLLPRADNASGPALRTAFGGHPRQSRVCSSRSAIRSRCRPGRRPLTGRSARTSGDLTPRSTRLHCPAPAALSRPLPGPLLCGAALAGAGIVRLTQQRVDLAKQVGSYPRSQLKHLRAPPGGSATGRAATGTARGGPCAAAEAPIVYLSARFTGTAVWMTSWPPINGSICPHLLDLAPGALCSYQRDQAADLRKCQR